MESSSRKQWIVWGGLLIFFGVVGLIQTATDLTEWGWISLLTIASLVVLAVYFTDRSNWSLLIPAYVMLAVAGLVALTTLDVLRDEAIASYVLSAIALPFLVVFGYDRSQWWALIPAYVLLAVGLMVGLIGQNILTDLLIPAYVMFAIAIPFVVVYTRNPKQWWPLIPAVVMAGIGVSLLLAEAALQYILPVALILAGVLILVRMIVRSEPTPPDAPS